MKRIYCFQPCRSFQNSGYESHDDECVVRYFPGDSTPASRLVAIYVEGGCFFYASTRSRFLLILHRSHQLSKPPTISFQDMLNLPWAQLNIKPDTFRGAARTIAYTLEQPAYYHNFRCQYSRQ